MIGLRPSPSKLSRYYEAGHWRRDSIPGLFSARVSENPSKLAVKDAQGNRVTYGHLENLVDRFAGFLKRRGIGRGDVVTMHLPNWWHTAVVMLSTYKLGAVVHPAPSAYGWHDLAYAIRKCGSKVVVIAGRFRKTDYTENLDRIWRVEGLRPELVVIGNGNVNRGTSFDEAVSGAPLIDLCELEVDDPSTVLFTSGTESRPKGAVHTQNTILYGERVFKEALHLTKDDVCFMASPVTHTTGYMHGLVLGLTSGSTVTLLDAFAGEAAVNIMAGDGVTWTMGATPFLVDTINVLEEKGIRLPSFRFFLCAGAPIPEVIVRRAQGLGIRVLPIYGSTESPPHTMTLPESPLEASWLTDGQGLPGIETKVVDPSGRELPVGQIGEQLSRGPNTFIGYLGEPDFTRKSLDEEGWYHSGDLALMHADGSLKIVGRIKDMIIRGGHNISAREVEDLLIAHPAVHEVAVIGVPHPRLGEMTVAVIVPKGDTPPTLDDLLRFLIAKGTSKYKLPEQLYVWDALPRTPSGKVQKFIIKEKIGADGR